MDKEETTAMPPPIPSAPAKCWWRLALRVIGRVLFGYAIILLITTPIPPIEPPSNMSWEEFEKWTDSGAWWKEGIRTCIIVAGIGIALMFIGKRKSSNHTSEGIRRPADGSPKPSM